MARGRGVEVSLFGLGILLLGLVTGQMAQVLDIPDRCPRFAPPGSKSPAPTPTVFGRYLSSCRRASASSH
jgi:hypothetical protein